MSADRELLELAAKAAGLIDMKWTGSGMARMLDPSRPETTGSIGRNWNPLTDDGDALRLAAGLGLSINVLGLSMSCSRHRDNGYLGGWMPRGIDDEADYRQAIVRAAAEIGRGMS